jgi:hypothetical protein
MTKEESKKLNFGSKVFIGVVVVVIIFALYLAISYKPKEEAVTPQEITTVEYKNASIDMNGDGTLDYVIYAEVILVGENQNLAPSQSPQE